MAHSRHHGKAEAMAILTRRTEVLTGAPILSGFKAQRAASGLFELGVFQADAAQRAGEDLRVVEDHRLARGLRRRNLGVDVLELGVAIGMPGALVVSLRRWPSCEAVVRW